MVNPRVCGEKEAQRPWPPRRVLLANRLLQRLNGRNDAGIDRHGQVFHFQRYPVVVAHHAHHREEFLPPLQIPPAADGDIVPGAAGHVMG